MIPLEVINDSDTIIVSFAGGLAPLNKTNSFEFVNFLNVHYPKCSKLFLADDQMYRYHRGIKGLTTDIDETTEYLKQKISGYKKVYFIGNSVGGYAAILFGSLLNVNSVIAFVPQTLCNMRNELRAFNPKYMDLKPLINCFTQYYLYADCSEKSETHPHHISHCTRLEEFKNVHIHIKKFLNIRLMRDSGELEKILKSIIE